jgi:hypothetical protein
LQPVEESIRRPRPCANALVAVCSLAAAARIFAMIDRHAVNVLFWDQFTYYQALADGTGAWGLFRWQHGPHRQGLPFLFTAALARATDWNTRGDAFLVGAAVAISAALALWLRRRLFGPFHPADVAIPLLVFTPAQYGIFIHTPNPSHGAGPVALLLAICLAFTVRSRAVRYGAVAALDFALVHSGFGIVGGALAPPLLAACAVRDARTGGARAAIPAGLAVLLSLLAIAIFAIGYDTRDLAAVPAARPPLAAYGRYVALMFANVLGVKGGGAVVISVGGLAAIAVLAVAAEQGFRLLRAPAAPPQREVIFALTAFSLLFAAATAYGRIAFGFPGAQATRYVPLLVPGLLGIYLRLQEIERPRLRAALSAASALAVVLATFPMRASEARFMEHLSRGKGAWVEVYLETGDLAQANRRAGVSIFPFEAPEVPRMLDYLREHHLNFYADH